MTKKKNLKKKNWCNIYVKDSNAIKIILQKSLFVATVNPADNISSSNFKIHLDSIKMAT